MPRSCLKISLRHNDLVVAFQPRRRRRCQGVRAQCRLHLSKHLSLPSAVSSYSTRSPPLPLTGTGCTSLFVVPAPAAPCRSNTTAAADRVSLLGVGTAVKANSPSRSRSRSATRRFVYASRLLEQQGLEPSVYRQSPRGPLEQERRKAVAALQQQRHYAAEITHARARRQEGHE
jgi:hypothetical protein